MKTLKAVDFEKRLSSLEEVEKLQSELKAFQVGEESTPDQRLDYRTVCDRILRACNQRLGASKSCHAYFQSLLVLAEVACRGYMAAAADQRTPLYLEKILFHFLKNVVAHGAYDGCSRFADVLYDLLASSKLSDEHEKDYLAIAKNCFTILWKGAEGVTKSGQWTLPESRTALCIRLHAVRYLVLLEVKKLVPLPSEMSSCVSLVTRHAAAAATIYETQRKPLTKEDILFLSDEIHNLLVKSLAEGANGPDPLNLQQASCLLELTLERCRRLCKNDCFMKALEAIQESQVYLEPVHDSAALDLCRLGVELQQSTPVGAVLKKGQVLVQRIIETENSPCQILTDCSQFVVSAVDQCVKKIGSVVFALHDVLALAHFLELHCQLLHKRMQFTSMELKERRSLKLQLYSCYQLYTTVVNNFLQDLQDEKPAELKELLKSCTETVCRMLVELDDLSEQDQEEYLGLTASCAFNLAYRFYSLKMYVESCDVMGILCEKLAAGEPSGSPDLAVEKLHKFFRLQVECCRKAGLFNQAFHFVALWLIALRGQITEQKEDPISLWVRVKMDAVKSGNEDVRLKTVKDCLADTSMKTLKPNTLIMLLSDELKAYKAVHANTGQERYNVICDLLEICSEDSTFLHERAVNLVELAQVLCYHDYTDQTDCSALDSVQEALHLLDALPVTPENADQLMDDKALARLWLFICSLESKMKESMELEQRGGSYRAQVQRNLGEFEPNDLNYEDKLQEEKFAYDGIISDLGADSGRSKCLDEALALWKKLLSSKHVPKVHSTEQTLASLHILGALYRLMGKTLQSIDSYILARSLSDAIGDSFAKVNALCHLAKSLILLGCPSYAKVTEGVTLLLEILKHPLLHKSSKAWYLLRANILQLLALYLCIPSTSLSLELRQQLCDQGWTTPETALTDAHKLLRSIVVLLLGNAVFTTKVTADTQFVDHGDNLLQKWQVLGDLLSCSHNLVDLLSRVGSVSEAKAFCLEALNVSVKLQAVRQCAEFLVTKAELELQRTESELCQLDLQQVLNLLTCGTVNTTAKQEKVKIKLKKGKPLNKEVKAGNAVLPEEEGFLKCLSLEFVDVVTVDKQSALTSSPVLKLNQKHPGFLSHPNNCTCSLCSDLSLSVLCIRWAITFAEMQLATGNPSDGSSLFRIALQRCVAFTSRFSNVIQNALSREARDSTLKEIKGLSSMRLADVHVAQIYTNLAILSSAGKPQKAIVYMNAGLNFITSSVGHSLEHNKAELLLAQALNSLNNLSSKYGGSFSDIFSPLWAWIPPLPSTSIKIKGPTKISETVPPPLKGVSKVLTNGLKNKAPTVKQQTVPHLSDIKDAFSLDDSDTEVPPIVIKPTCGLTTPMQKCFPVALQPKSSFKVFNEESLPVDKHLARAPKASRKMRSRLKVVFSDESEEENETTSKSEPVFPIDKREGQATYARARQSTRNTESVNSKAEHSQNITEQCPRRGRPRSKEPDIGSTADSDKPKKTIRRTTRGRPNLMQDEVEVLRVIHEEDTKGAFEISFEVLRGSDCEEEKPAKGRRKRTTTAVHDAADGECEVLRRDASSDLNNWLPGAELKGADLNPFDMQDLSVSLQSAISTSDVAAIYGSLKDAFNCIGHYPPSALYGQLCQLMALCLGSQDPYTTAYLVSESLAVTTRHQLISNIHRKLRKKKRDGSLDMSDQLQDLLLLDVGNGDMQAQHLSELENLFQFSYSGLHTDHFRQQLEQIPNDVVVCLLTLVHSHPGATGDILLLTRLERAHTPITVYIPTAKTKVSLSSALHEFDAIQKEQKEISNLTDKMEWWEGRSALDKRMKLLVESLEHQILGCWKGLLLPSCSDARVAEEARSLAEALGACGLEKANPEGLLKAILNGSHILSRQNVRNLALGLCQSQPQHALNHLQTAVDKLKTLTVKSSGHLVLVLDKHLQKLPWESLPLLISSPVTRLPSLRFLLSYNLLKKYCPQSAYTRGVNPDSTYYVLNPHGNLPGTEERFRDWFQSESKWNGVTGKAPRPEHVQAGITQHDLYIYAGHGAGAYFLDGQALLKLDCNAVSLLFGCSSAALAVRGKLEGAGIILKYLMAGCPLVLGNLWDVTDRDIDRYMAALLKNWMKAGSGAPILPYIAQSRQAPKLKFLIGAAPIAYGMPVALR
ncbi:separin isoform X2 [Ambystoma mexicanum]|uniref:separin isoform X2 n=1 Tax=Ambystoma mexicanum TaxID=8296 RepID=UPI0037E9654C